MRKFYIILSLACVCLGASSTVPQHPSRKSLPRKFDSRSGSSMQKRVPASSPQGCRPEDFYGEFTMEYGSYISQLYFTSNVTIAPAEEEDAVTLTGFYDDDSSALNATIDPATGTLTIPSQEMEWYGDTYLLTTCDYDRDTEEAVPTPSRPLTGYMADDGLISFPEAWMLVDTSDDSTWDICDFTKMYITNSTMSFGLDGEDWEDGVFARLEDSLLTIYNFGYLGSIEFTIDPQAGVVRSAPDQIFLTNEDGDWYYATILEYDENDPEAAFSYELGLTGTITGDDNSEIEIPDWSGICPVEGEDPWWAGLYTSTHIKLPFNLLANTGISSATHESQTVTEYYNLQGVRVSAPGKGLYIVRQGEHTVKQFIH